ncbi:MAG: inositol monophosphatase family protein [Candidatus Hodgkinia cicadicola]
MSKTIGFYLRVVDLILKSSTDLTIKTNRSLRTRCSSKSNYRFDPVTWFDRIIETNIFNIIRTMTPKVSFYGEEFGYLHGFEDNKNMWIIDPIDGTKSFVCGSITWGTILAYINGNNVLIGALDFPVLNERLISVLGNVYIKYNNCYKLAPKVTNSKIKLSECIIATSTEESMSLIEKIAFKALKKNVLHVIKDYDCYAFWLLATGKIDAIVECGLKPHDIIGLIPIANGLGCFVSDWRGNSTCFGRKIIITRNKELLTEISLKLLPFLI